MIRFEDPKVFNVNYKLSLHSKDHSYQRENSSIYKNQLKGKSIFRKGIFINVFKNFFQYILLARKKENNQTIFSHPLVSINS